MLKKFSGYYPTFVALISVLVIAISAPQASHTQDPEINFAQLIVTEIEDLQSAALASSMPTKQARQINNRLRVSIFMLAQGIANLQLDKDKQATISFKNVKHFINLYLKLLSQQDRSVGQHYQLVCW